MSKQNIDQDPGKEPGLYEEHAVFIREARAILGMTQQEFGERLGKSKQTVNRWESGHYELDVYLFEWCEAIVRAVKSAPSTFIIEIEEEGKSREAMMTPAEVIKAKASLAQLLEFTEEERNQKVQDEEEELWKISESLTRPY